VGPGTRDDVVDLVRRRPERTEVRVDRFLGGDWVRQVLMMAGALRPGERAQRLCAGSRGSRVRCHVQGFPEGVSLSQKTGHAG